jgi:hypothetical protein
VIWRAASIFFSAILAAALVGPSIALADPFSAWTPGPDAILDNTYDGYIDVPAMNATVPAGGFTVSGWFFDTTAEGWAGADDVQVWQGTMDGGGKLLAHLNVALPRPDVAAAVGNPSATNSGFGGSVPGNALAPGGQTLSVYVHTGGKGWWYRQVQVNVAAPAAVAPAAPAAPAPAASSGGLPIVGIEKPKDGEQVLTKADYDLVGYALDKNATGKQGVAGSGVDRVSLYIGPRDEKGSVYLGDADLGYSDSTPVGLYGGQFANSGWRLTFHPTAFHANTYLLYAYARSALSGKEDSAVRYFAIKEVTP